MRFLRSTAAVAAVAAAMLSQNASAVNLSTDGIGEVAIAPYYTTRDNWQTLINLVNTQTEPVVVKVRFHEALNSRDVFDFTVALSALDTFVGVVRMGANGAPEFVNVDAPNNDGRVTCTIPAIGVSEVNAVSLQNGLGGFSGTDYAGDSNDDGGIQTFDRLAEGYIEFIVEGYAIGDKDPDYDFNASLSSRRLAIGNAIENHDCVAVRSAFISDNIDQTAPQFGEPINALKFNFALLNVEKGVQVGYSATTWANFYNPGNGNGAFPLTLQGQVLPDDNEFCELHRGIERDSDTFGTGTLTNWCPDGSFGDACLPADLATAVVAGEAVLGAGASCRNLITAQQPDAFLEPTLNDAYPALAAGWFDPQNVFAVVQPDLLNWRGDVDGNGVEGVRGVDALSLTIQRSAIINDWSVNPQLGVSTDWIITQPTKAFYVDQGAGAQFQVITKLLDATQPAGAAALSPNPGGTADDILLPVKGRDEAVLTDQTGLGVVANVPYAPYQRAFAQTTPNSRPTAKACNDIAIDLRDRAEQGSAEADEEEPVFSPSLPVPTVKKQLCYEVTVLNFEDRQGGVPSVLGDALNRLVVETDGLITTDAKGQTFGWMSLDLTDFAGAQLSFTDIGGTVGPVDALAGLPVIGVNFKSLVLPNNALKNYATAADHSYARETVQ